jgi:hypothetical protein
MALGALTRTALGKAWSAKVKAGTAFRILISLQGKEI